MKKKYENELKDDSEQFSEPIELDGTELKDRVRNCGSV